MLLDQQGIESLKAEACDKALAEAPCMHIMPNFDALAYEWGLEKIPNGFIRDEFCIFSDLDSHATYAIFKQEGGFFRAGSMMMAGGLEIPASALKLDPAYEAEAEEKISIAGYQWEEDGQTYLLSNSSKIEDGCNEAWADCDDWLFGPFFFGDFNADGTSREAAPEGMIPCYGGDEEFLPAPDAEEMEKLLFELGFQRSAGQIEELEALMHK